MSDFQGEVASGDRRRAYIALRDMLAESMEDLHDSLKANAGLCRRCGGSLSESGLASLAQRLTQTMDALDALGEEDVKETRLMRARKTLYGGGDTGVAEAADSAPAELGTKRAKRRQGGRRASGSGGTGT